MEQVGKTSGVNWDEWTAIGTLALAFVTVAAVIVSVWLAGREANRTDARLIADRLRADDAVVTEAQRNRAREERAGIVDLLLRLSHALAVIHGMQSDPVMALAESPQLCSAKFPTLQR